MDPEAGEKKSRSWPSLLLTAIVYVWPDTPGLQLRAILCIVIIAVMRLLNLAVPILYKHVVDTMANVSARTHPTGPEAPQTFNFIQVSSFLQSLLYVIARMSSRGLLPGIASLSCHVVSHCPSCCSSADPDPSLLKVNNARLNNAKCQRSLALGQ